jgi:hypothetical protein
VLEIFQHTLKYLRRRLSLSRFDLICSFVGALQASNSVDC